MNIVIKIKNIIIYILGGLFILGMFIHMFLYKMIYRFYVDLGDYDGNRINHITDSPYLFFLIIFIIIMVDLIIDLWYKKKLQFKVTSYISIVLFAFISIFSAPFRYISIKDSSTYKLDKLLTIMDFHSNENDFEGGHNIRKYIYIPFSDVIIFIDGSKIIVEKIDEDKISTKNYYYKES